jgi:hypothetical protein
MKDDLSFVVVRTSMTELGTYLRAYVPPTSQQPASPETLRAYRADWALFERWCAVHELASGLRPGQRWHYTYGDARALCGRCLLGTRARRSQLARPYGTSWPACAKLRAAPPRRQAADLLTATQFGC